MSVTPWIDECRRQGLDPHEVVRQLIDMRADEVTDDHLQARWALLAELYPGERDDLAYFQATGATYHYRVFSRLGQDELTTSEDHAQLSRDGNMPHYRSHRYGHDRIDKNIAAGRAWYENIGLPGAHVVYSLVAWDGTVVYVGVTSDLSRRLSQHAKKWWFMVVNPSACSFWEEPTRQEALEAEAEFIKWHQPAMNRAGRVLIPRYLDVPR